MDSLGSILSGVIAGICISAAGAWLLFRRLEVSHRREAREAIEAARTQFERSAERARTEAEAEIARHRREIEEEITTIRREQGETEAALAARTAAIEIREQDLAKQESDLAERKSRLNEETVRVDEERRKYRAALAQRASMTEDDAREQLRNAVRDECGEELRALKREIIGQGESDLQERARRMLIDAIQRLASEPNHDITATLVKIPSEDMKGRIIGREGRNIKAFELATGVTLLIDETPDSVLLSSFDPVRREIARLALLRLVKDGRIHPGSIEEAVKQAEEEMRQNVIEFGESALRSLRLTQVHPDIIAVVGKLHYRLSNNQNTLHHSVEVAHIAGLIAAELGLDTNLARRAGLFHDMGKVLDQEHEGSHAVAAARMLQRHGEDPRVINAVESHHGEVSPDSVYAGVLIAADTISAQRPGARAESLDAYLQRVRRLEEIARAEPGIREAYAIQAGREVRVIVEAESYDDAGARLLARGLRRKIEEELHYPGSIRVTVIRETRFTETAQ